MHRRSTIAASAESARRLAQAGPGPAARRSAGVLLAPRSVEVSSAAHLDRTARSPPLSCHDQPTYRSKASDLPAPPLGGPAMRPPEPASTARTRSNDFSTRSPAETDATWPRRTDQRPCGARGRQRHSTVHRLECAGRLHRSGETTADGSERGSPRDQVHASSSQGTASREEQLDSIQKSRRRPSGAVAPGRSTAATSSSPAGVHEMQTHHRRHRHVEDR